jgi:hypothetical protein
VAAPIRAGASGIVLLAVGLSLSACGGSQDAAVSEVVERFYSAVEDGDGEAACALLVPATRRELEQSSGTACAAAILAEDGDLGSGDGGVVEVYDTMAQVRFEGDTAAFLARLPDGWRVLAAACTPRAVGPYDCTVKGA